MTSELPNFSVFVQSTPYQSLDLKFWISHGLWLFSTQKLVRSFRLISWNWRPLLYDQRAICAQIIILISWSVKCLSVIWKVNKETWHDTCLLCLNLTFETVWIYRSVFEVHVGCRCLRVENSKCLQVDGGFQSLSSYLQLNNLSTLLWSIFSKSGQVSPNFHSPAALTYRPHIIITLMDTSKPK